MLISYLWLKELVDFPHNPEEMAAALTGLGLETSVVDDRRGWYQNVITGRVLEVTRHPNADKLSLCTVDTGEEKRSIVCGAPNVAAGQDVPVALEGAVLPGGTRVEHRTVRGEVSEGMILSEAELGLSDDHEGIMVLDDDPAPGEAFNERYEVCDTILEIDLTPNRGDCLSMIGVAREVAALTGAALRRPEVDIKEGSEESSSRVSVEITAPDLCPRYTGRVITGLTVGPSPFWMRRRLHALGVRAINNLVDVTNYVLLETGHPLHAFDSSFIDGNRIIVRRAEEGERFTTLDGREHALDPDILVIADAERAVALGGVMGGENSEVTETTAEVILEAAFFNPGSIRRTSKALNIKTESSYRFERGCDVEGLIYAIDRAAALMASIGGGKALKGRVDAYPEPIGKKEVTLRYARANKILGITTPPERVREILSRLEMTIVDEANDSVTVAGPSFRFDIEREIDLIEEVARFVGYEGVASAIPQVSVNAGGVSRSLDARRAIRRHLRSLGLMEGLSYSFVSEAGLDRLRLPQDHSFRRLVTIDNPLTSEWTHLRPSLLPGLVAAATGAETLSLFEIGVVFTENGSDAPNERWLVSGALTETASPDLWNGKTALRDFFHVKGVVESVVSFLGFRDIRVTPSGHPFYYPKRQADVLADNVTVGHFGQAHPETARAYEVGQELFLFELEIDALLSIRAATPRFSALPRFPSVKRDLAVVAPEAVTVEALLSCIRSHGGALLRETVVFDVYSGPSIGEGKRSVAFSLEFRDDARTLNDDDANEVFARILAGLKTDCGAALR